MGFVSPGSSSFTPAGMDKYRECFRIGPDKWAKEWDSRHRHGWACECGRGHTMLSCTAEGNDPRYL